MRTIILFVASSAALLIQAQPALQPEFEVASIRPAPPQPAGHTNTNISVYNNSSNGSKGKLNYTNVTVKQILEQAYRLQPYEISGGPGWMDSDRFDIAAVIPAGASSRDIGLMLQNLL